MNTLVHDRVVDFGGGGGLQSDRCSRTCQPFAGLILMGALGLAACASQPSTPAQATVTPTPSQTRVVTLTGTPTMTATRLPTRTARPTLTPTPMARLDPR